MCIYISEPIPIFDLDRHRRGIAEPSVRRSTGLLIVQVRFFIVAVLNFTLTDRRCSVQARQADAQNDQGSHAG